MRKMVVVGLCFGGAALAVGLGISLWSRGSTKAEMGFESGTLDGWLLQRLAGASSAAAVSSPVRWGKFAASVTLPGSKDPDARFKSELSDDFNAPFGKEIWYRISHYVPSVFRSGDNPCVLAQWHNVAPQGIEGGKPPIAHRIQGDEFDVTVEWHHKPRESEKDATRVYFYQIQKFPRDSWQDFVYRVVWSAAEDGAVDLWHNGKHVASRRGPIGYPGDPWGPYFKTGVYCKHAPRDGDLTAFVDEYRRGPTAADVLLPGEVLGAWGDSTQ